jgi:bacillithiol biosynthesis cysteine-adding enzyme BshC
MDSLFARARALSRESSRYPLNSLRDILARENRRIGAVDTALESVRSIGPGAVFVVAGQQAGLFGGPLYTLYKAMHAVRLAERIAAATGTTVIPVFWTASDDHDFDEVRSIGVRTAAGAPFRVEYTPGGRIEGAPVGEIMLDDSVGAVIDSLAGRLIPGERAESYVGLLRRSWTPGTRWSDAFSAQIAAFLSRKGLVVLDPRWSEVKRLFAHVMRAELEDPLASSALVNREADRLETEGSPAFARKSRGASESRRSALRRREGATNLFLETGGARQVITFTEGMFRAGEERFSPGEILALLDAEPERFSPGAALRPVCQDALMPVAALIAGPGERAYLDQIGLLYDMFAVDRSFVWPRASFTLLDRRSLRAAEKAGIPARSIFRGMDGIRGEIALASFPAELARALDALEWGTDSGFDEVAESLAALDPTLAKSARTEKGRVLHSILGIRERAIRAHKARLEIADARLAAASHFLLPGGKPQERWFGADSAFILLGTEGLDELLALASPGEERHRMVMYSESGTPGGTT